MSEVPSCLKPTIPWGKVGAAGFEPATSTSYCIILYFLQFNIQGLRSNRSLAGLERSLIQVGREGRSSLGACLFLFCGGSICLSGRNER